MKKSLVLLSVLASINAYAGSIDYLAEQDSEYFAHPSMIGKIGTSAAFYNPAGTAFMEDGTYFKINSQTVFKKYKMETNYPTIDKCGVHESDHPSALVPAIQFVLKEGDRSYFVHAGVAAGGGALKYDGGLTAFEVIGEAIEVAAKKGAFGNFPNSTVTYLDSPQAIGSSYYINTNFGMAQKINSKFSVGGAIRLIYATRDLDCTANYDLSLPGTSKTNQNVQVKLDAERKAYGVGGVIGFDYKPTDKLNIGFKYESEIELYFKSKKGRDGLTVKSDIYPDVITSGIKENLLNEKVISEWLDKERRNLPAVIALGLAYDLNDKVTLLASGNYYFIKEANRDGAYDNYDNGYELSAGIDYKLNDKITLMAGYQYTDTGANKNTYKDTDFALDADLYGVGIKYSPRENRAYTLTYSYVDYKTAQANTDYSNKGTGTIFSKTVQAIGISAEFKF
ncbi:OmpP1/FadL family transporter [Fusobacterium sp. MFO224]|uniref:OmpP1/FadL family transporter n=1 Tax=Fusobacterium sp. MFO224 TaxID=3378070 RepID=UPI00385301A5